MKQVSVTLSTYTADVSGVCSALYELGGMVVIHDPSGCNSTYNTHDEPRWYEMDSLVFISGLSQMDAIMGNDDKFIHDIVRAAKELQPRFIALVRTPIPLMTSGMHTYVKGAGMAMETIARELVPAGRKSVKERKNKQENPLKINILGATPLDFSINSTLDSIKEFLSRHFEIISTFAMGSSIEDIQRAGEADVNLVISSVGVLAAKVLEERFHTPYVIGTPIIGFENVLAEKLIESAWTKKSQTAYFSVLQKAHKKDTANFTTIQNAEAVSNLKKIRSLTETIEKNKVSGNVYIIGESVISQSLKAALALRYKIEATVICPLETEPEYTEKDVLLFSSEEDIKKAITDADTVIADPIYKTICSEKVNFVAMPHEAYSGRIYRKEVCDFIH